MKNIEIIIPLFNEEKNIKPLHKEICRCIEPITDFNFTILFVDDGSKDNSLLEIDAISKLDRRVKGISFSRNFGKEIALTAGIRASVADAVILMDADLQHPPAMIPQMLSEWQKGFDVIACERYYSEARPPLRRLGSFIFNKVMQKISETDVQGASTDFRLLDRKVIEVLKTFTERNRLVRGLIDWLGFKRSRIAFEAPSRMHGEESYSFVKLARLAINSFTSFSLLPLKVTGYLGIAFFTVFGLLLIVMLVDRLGSNSLGFTNLAIIAVVNSFSLGIVMIGIGLIALYIGHIYTESVNRPMYVIRDKINFEDTNV